MRISQIPAISMIFTLGAVIGACDSMTREPSDADAQKALEQYYTQQVRYGRAPLPASGRPERGIDDQTGAPEPDSGQDDQEAVILDDRECVRVRVIKRRENGRIVEERVEIPCDIGDAVEAGIAAGMRVLSEAVQGVSTAVERELARYHVTAVAAVDVIACVPAVEKPGHVCDLDAELVYGEDAIHLETLTGRFVRGDDGWRVISVEPAK